MLERVKNKNNVAPVANTHSSDYHLLWQSRMHISKVETPVVKKALLGSFVGAVWKGGRAFG